MAHEPPIQTAPTAAAADELRVDDGDRQPPGVVGFDRIRRLKQFFLGRERSLFLEFHLGCMIAMPMASVGRFSPLGPLGIIFFLFLCRPILSF
jgi:hypothetical protein